VSRDSHGASTVGPRRSGLELELYMINDGQPVLFWTT